MSSRSIISHDTRVSVVERPILGAKWCCHATIHFTHHCRRWLCRLVAYMRRRMPAPIPSAKFTFRSTFIAMTLCLFYRLGRLIQMHYNYSDHQFSRDIVWYRWWKAFALWHHYMPMHWPSLMAITFSSPPFYMWVLHMSIYYGLFCLSSDTKHNRQHIIIVPVARYTHTIWCYWSFVLITRNRRQYNFEVTLCVCVCVAWWSDEVTLFMRCRICIRGWKHIHQFRLKSVGKRLHRFTVYGLRYASCMP